jgi:Cytidylate kinase
MPTNKNSKPPVVSIDGPGGAAKGTAARRLAKALGWHLLDSGMIYRALGVASIQSGIATSEHSALAKLAVQMDIRFQVTADDGLAVFLGAQEVSETIRSEEAGRMPLR